MNSVVNAHIERQLEDGTVQLRLDILDPHIDQPVSVLLSVYRGEVVLFSDVEEGQPEDVEVVIRRG